MSTINDPILIAYRNKTAIPMFNIPYLPMVESVVRALRDTRTKAMIAVARLEWEKFESESPEAVRDEYEKHKDERYTLLHLDHVPVIDEDDNYVDYEAIMTRAINAGYQSLMIDGSRLNLAENIEATKKVVTMGHEAGRAVEAELGAVLGHEEGPLPPYEALFASGKGFTDPQQALEFVQKTGVDWLSVAIGNIHGAISKAKKSEKKVAARLHIDHLKNIASVTNIPLVLHGGTNIQKEYILEGIQNGIAKINVATAIRQPYETALRDSLEAAKNAVYEATIKVVTEDLEVAGSADAIDWANG